MLALGISELDESILNRIWEAGKPINAQEISEATSLDNQSVYAHLQDLKEAGFVTAAGRSSYAITDEGKEALGFPRINKQTAKEILSKVPSESAFPFYAESNRPLGISSDSLIDLCEKIRSVDVKSLEFHTARGDFETWAHYLTDIELKKRLRSIKETNLSGEALRTRLYETLKSRCRELLKIVT